MLRHSRAGKGRQTRSHLCQSTKRGDSSLQRRVLPMGTSVPLTVLPAQQAASLGFLSIIFILLCAFEVFSYLKRGNWFIENRSAELLC